MITLFHYFIHRATFALLLQDDGAERVPCPWLTLLAFAPLTIRRLVAVPGTAILGELLERYPVHMTVWAVVMRWLRGGLGRWLYGRLCNGILPQERRQPGQEPSFIGVT